jgi:hypothetical protein
LNLCAGSPDYSQLSPFAQQYHAIWGNSPDLVMSRRAEDKAVLDKWEVTAHYCKTLDSIYRCIKGKVAYPDLTALFAAPHPQELETLPLMWQQELESLYSHSADVIIYAPLAAGNHVDHQLTRVLGWQLLNAGWQVWFYEDYPHAESPGTLSAARAWFGAVSWQAKTVSIDVNAKIAAIQGYKTQMIPFIFSNASTLARRVKQFTAETACHISLRERIRRQLAGAGGRREQIWRAICGYHVHAERIWKPI